MKAKYISFEGIDGAGKSSHIAPLAALLGYAGHQVVTTREPGGTDVAEKLRVILLHEYMSPLAETLLMFAARKENLERVILPALLSGKTVISDRFTDSSFAYQGGGKGVKETDLNALENMVQDVGGELIQPDLTLWFDLDPREAAARRATARQADKFESEDVDFFERVRNAYLRRQEASCGRIVRIDASRPIDAVWFSVMTEVEKAGILSRQAVNQVDAVARPFTAEGTLRLAA